MKRIYAKFNLVNNDYIIEDYKIIEDSKEFRESQVDSLTKRGEFIETIHAANFICNNTNELVVGNVSEDLSNNKTRRKFKILSYNEVAEEIKKAYQFMIEQDLDELKQAWLNCEE